MSDTPETLHITLEMVGQTTFVCPLGRLDFATSPAFQHALEQAVAGGRTAPAAVVVDCRDLAYLSSAGLRGFLLGARAAQAAGVRFGVCALRPAVLDMFEASGFDKIIVVYPDRHAVPA